MLTPQYSTSQMIGHLGEKVFLGGCPDNWIKEASPQQGGDFAFDLSMWLTTLGKINGRFSVQLKAGANVKISGSDESYISVELTPQVCNLFLQDGNPVLLVFIALESPTSSKNAVMHYIWIKEELKKRLGDCTEFDENSPGNMSFRIPVANLLTKELEIIDYLRSYWTLNRIANRLHGTEHAAEALQTVSALSPRGIIGLTKADPNTLSRWFSNESMTGDSLWPTPKAGSSVAKIKQLAEYITHGNAMEADRLIADLNAHPLEDSESLAELRYQEGRRAFLDGDARSALARFSDANSLQPAVARYYAAELEAAVASSVGQAMRVPAEILSKAGKFGEDDDVQFQFVRVAALQEDFFRAEELISGLAEPNRTKAQTLYLAIRDDWEAVLSTANRGIADYPNSRTSKFLKLFKLRALLHSVIGAEGGITVGGRPDLKVSDAIALRDATIEALGEAQASGWPANSEMILDCAAAVCVIFGSDLELLKLLSDFSQKRVKLRDAHEALARIATFIEEPSIAISAIKRIADPEPVDLARLVLLLSESGAHAEAVEVAIANLIDKQHDTIIDIAVATAAVSAYRLGSMAEEEKLRAFVAEGDPAAQSLLSFISASLRHPEEREANLDRLWEDAMRDGGIEILQDNLLQYLRPDRENDVDRILAICAITTSRRNLTDMEASKYSAALLRRERFQELVDFTDRAQEFYPHNENVGLTRAIALERMGYPSAAEQVLRRFDGSVRTDLVNARTQLLLRIGDIDSLVSLTKQALAGATEHAERFHYHRTLATLYSRIDRSQYLESVWRLGEIVDKDIEVEEGTFLLHFLMATAGDGVEILQPRAQEVQERVKRFTQRFPLSSILRVGHISEDTSAEELFSQFQELAGVSEEHARAQQKARTLGERSGSHIPFDFRPRTYAPYASNLVDLLRIAINAWHQGESSRIIVGDVTFPSSLPSAPPILDLVTMLSLVELDLFDKLFSVWTAIAIPKESLAHLSELMFGPLDVGNSDLIDKAVKALRRNHAAIVQPGPPIGTEAYFPVSALATIRAEVAANRYEYLTIDLAAAAILRTDASIAGRCRTIWDFLQTAEEKGAITRAESILVRLRVASWNTAGVPLEAGDIAAVSLGSQASDAAENGASARAVRQFITGGDLLHSMTGASHTLVELAKSTKPSHRKAADWFIRIFYTESVLARSTGFDGNTDDLTASLAVLVVRDAHEDLNALEIMQFSWQVLEQARISFGGHCDRDNFYELLGIHAAKMFDKVIKKYGFDAIGAEAKLRELLFSLATNGTHDRDVLERAFYERTLALQNN